jgi:antitoxin MazE
MNTPPAPEGLMRTRVEAFPGGVAVVVPQEVAARAGLRGGEPADLELDGGRLVIRPAGPATLAELLAGITPENVHGEWAAGPPAGAELL